MNVAIVHYHLNRGGVTRVIANHLLAWDSLLPRDQTGRAAILFGGRDAGWPHDLADRLQSVELSLHPIEGIDYDELQSPNPAALADRLRNALRRLGFSPRQTVVHVHNHSLGKNVSLPGALQVLAQDGFGLLLQIHDFAEDFRPQGYRRLALALGHDKLPGLLYPQSSRIHYAVLNRRDHRVLRQAGTHGKRLHYLPNTAPDLHSSAQRVPARRKLQERFGVSPSQQFVLYPVRGIRRKNVGEALLWALLQSRTLGVRETVVGMTLAPLNPAEQKTYRHWKQVASDLRLPFLFECGESGGLSFEENVTSADRILTTSVAEGFGMAFLESWLAGKPLAGRNLSEVTADFTDAGLRFPDLYDRLEIPIDWVGRGRFADVLRSGLTRVLAAYGRSPLDPGRWDEVLSRKIRGGCVDFGDLDEPLQEQVLRIAASDAAALGELRERNPVIRAGARTGKRSMSVEADARYNQRLIRGAYSLQPSGRRLHDTYEAVLGSPQAGEITDPSATERILDSFLDPARFRLIRS